MNITQLRTFLTVIDQGSFSEAARTLGVSQPAVTMQIQNLESAVGQPLLDRRYRRLDLTEAGRALMPHARKMIADAQRARDDIAALSGSVTGKLHIAVSTTPGDYVVPRLLGSFVDRYPGVHLSIEVASSAAVVALIDDRKADVGIVGAQIRGYKVGYTPLGHDELIVICPPTHLLTDLAVVLWSDLAVERWVMRATDSGTQQVLADFMMKQGLDSRALHVAVELGTGEAVVNAVEGGLGIAVVSRMVAEKALALRTVCEVPVEGMPLVRPFYLTKGHGALTRATAAFVEFIERAFKAEDDRTMNS